MFGVIRENEREGNLNEEELKMKNKYERSMRGNGQEKYRNPMRFQAFYAAFCLKLIYSTYRYSLFTNMDVRSNSILLNKDDIEYVSLTIMSWMVSSIFMIERGIFLRSRYSLKKTFKVPFSNLSIMVCLQDKPSTLLLNRSSNWK